MRAFPSHPIAELRRTGAVTVRGRRVPAWAVVALAALLAAAVTLPFSPSPRFDAQGWLRWGRQILFGGDFTTADYPSWKPLPTLVTVPLALTGPVGPLLWLLLTRTAGLLALALAFRLATRLADPRAGALAVIALVLVPGWWSTWIGGHIEPLVLAMLLGAVERHRAGHHTQALALGSLVALGREEALPLVVAYAALGLRRGRIRALPATALVALVPALWLGGDWIGSGDPFRAGELARQATDAAAQRVHGWPPAYVAGLAWRLFALPLWAALVFGIAWAARRRDRLALTLALAGAAWLATDVAMSAAGYPGELRFMIPAAGVLAVVAAAGAVRALAQAPLGRSVKPVLVALAVAALPQAVATAVSPPKRLGVGPESARVDASMRRARTLMLEARAQTVRVPVRPPADRP